MNSSLQALNKLVPAHARRAIKYYTLHYGLRFRCPFCNSSLRRLRAFGFDFPVLQEKQVVGGGLRDNCLCPVCDSTDRERLLFLFLRNRTSLFAKPVRLLHVAPEPELRKEIEKHSNVDYITADLLRPNVKVKLDVTDIRYADDYFDAIVCNHVLEHVPDDRRAMAELFRVLKPGGWAILQVPISYVLRETHEDPSIVSETAREQAFGQCDHVRIYAFDYLDRLRGVGFELDPFDWTTQGAAFGAPSNRYALNKDEKVFAATKPREPQAGTVNGGR
jgi:SAM-dependent methyltransferase